MIKIVHKPVQSLVIFLVAVFLLMASSPADAASVGDDVKCIGETAIYHLAENGTRYAYPNEKAWKSWHDNFDHVKVISCEDLADVEFGGLVNYQAGVRLLKIPSVPVVYAVSSDGLLRPIKDEEQAKRLYGDKWAQMVDDVSEAFFPRYTVGDRLNDDELPEGMLLGGNDGSILRVDDQGVAVELDTILDEDKKIFYKQYTHDLARLESEMDRTIEAIRDLEDKLEEKWRQLRALKTIMLSDEEILEHFVEIEDIDGYDILDDDELEKDDSDRGTLNQDDPDLMVTDVYVSDSGILTAVITNEGYGDVPTENFGIYFWFDGKLEWTYNVSTLADKSFILRQHHAMISPQPWAQDAQVGVCVDVNEQVVESIEQNNCWNGFLKAAPDSVLEALKSSTDIDRDEDGITDKESTNLEDRLDKEDSENEAEEQDNSSTDSQDKEASDLDDHFTSDDSDDQKIDEVVESKEEKESDDAQIDDSDSTTDTVDDSASSQDGVAEAELFMHSLDEEVRDVILEDGVPVEAISMLVEAVGGDVLIKSLEVVLEGEIEEMPDHSSVFLVVEDVTTGVKTQFQSSAVATGEIGVYLIGDEFKVLVGHEVVVSVFINSEEFVNGDVLHPLVRVSKTEAFDFDQDQLSTVQMSPAGDLLSGMIYMFR